jgi:Fic family protein
MPQTKTPLEVMAALKLRLDQLRVHHAKALEGLTHPDDVMLTWTSNAIEGNTLTHGETAMLIEKGITVGGKSIAEHLAIQDHYEALQLVRRLAHKKAPLGETPAITPTYRAVSRGRQSSFLRRTKFQL